MIRDFIPSREPSASASIGGRGGGGGGGLLDAFRQRAAPPQPSSSLTLDNEGAVKSRVDKKVTKNIGVGGSTPSSCATSRGTSATSNNASSLYAPSSSSSSSSSGYSTSWSESSAASYSLTDMRVMNKAQYLNKDTKGWRVNSDGVREYTTFRNGQRVKATGAEAFRLAMGDGNGSKAPAKGGDRLLESSDALGDADMHAEPPPSIAGKRKSNELNDEINNAPKPGAPKQMKLLDSLLKRNSEK